MQRIFKCAQKPWRVARSYTEKPNNINALGEQFSLWRPATAGAHIGFALTIYDGLALVLCNSVAEMHRQQAWIKP